MLRHGYWPFTHPSLQAPALAQKLGFKHPFEHFTERTIPRSVRSDGGPSGGDGTKGVWIVRDPSRPPDVVVYYLHGGGFAMGSPWFYLEFLLAWSDLLISSSEPRDEHKDDGKKKGYQNPAIFALDYTLVPYATFPVQVEQVVAGWRFCCDLAGPDVPLEVAGDSAGATLALSLMLHLAREGLTGREPEEIEDRKQGNGEQQANGEERPDSKKRPDIALSRPLRKPNHATLISAWCRLISPLDQNNSSDYLNADSLHLYAREYMNTDASNHSHLENADGIEPLIASPADYADKYVWRNAIPDGGMHFIHGAEEVLAPEIRRLVKRLEGVKGGCTTVTEEKNQIHAWPVVDLFLAGEEAVRLRGLRRVVSTMKEMLHVWEGKRVKK